MVSLVFTLLFSLSVLLGEDAQIGCYDEKWLRCEKELFQIENVWKLGSFWRFFEEERKAVLLFMEAAKAHIGTYNYNASLKVRESAVFILLE